VTEQLRRLRATFSLLFTVISMAEQTKPMTDASEGMSYPQDLRETARQRLHALAADPDRAAVPLLLDGRDGHQTEGASALDLEKHNPLFTLSPTFKHIRKSPVQDPSIRSGSGTRCLSRSSPPFSALIARFLRPTRSRASASRAHDGSAGPSFMAYLVPPSILFHPALHRRLPIWAVRTPCRTDPDLSNHPDPFATWLLMGYFKTIPYELEECALIDGASRWQILIK